MISGVIKILSSKFCASLPCLLERISKDERYLVKLPHFTKECQVPGSVNKDK